MDSAEESEARSRAEVLGCRIDRLNMQETLERCERLFEGGTPTGGAPFAQHVAINAAKLVAMQDDPQLRAVVADCELVSADGQSVVWASRLLGDALPERVPGIDLMQELLALAERRGYGVYILGARPEVLDLAAQRIRRRHPRLRLTGLRDGYFREEDGGVVAEEVRRAQPHMLFVAISSPKKEYWLGRYGRDLGVPLVMGVGGSVDVLAGITRRAPDVLQILGLEWLYRLIQEPRRLLKRYLVTNTRFVLLVFREAVRRRIRADSLRRL